MIQSYSLVNIVINNSPSRSLLAIKITVVIRRAASDRRAGLGWRRSRLREKCMLGSCDDGAWVGLELLGWFGAIGLRQWCGLCLQLRRDEGALVQCLLVWQWMGVFSGWRKAGCCWRGESCGGGRGQGGRSGGHHRNGDDRDGHGGGRGRRLCRDRYVAMIRAGLLHPGHMVHSNGLSVRVNFCSPLLRLLLTAPSFLKLILFCWKKYRNKINYLSKFRTNWIFIGPYWY